MEKIKIISFIIFTILVLILNLSIANNLISFMQTASGLDFVAQSPATGMSTYFQVSIILTILMILPLSLFLILNYIRPALYKKEQEKLDNISNLIKLSISLFMIGMTFGTFIIFEYILPYLTNFNQLMNYQLLYQADVILMFIFLSIIYSGITFQTPMINYYLLKSGILNLKDIKVIRLFVIIGSLIIGAVITPPDVLSQFIFGIPIYILFEISTLIFKLNEKRRKI